jgi:hypothetical protein
MTVQTPAFLGLILRKNERTRRFIEQQLERSKEISPEARMLLDEDEYLVAVSVAMNGHDLQSTIEELEEHAVYGTDFVATGSPDGVLGDVPNWLSADSVRVGPYKQPTKIYSFVSSHEV